MCGIAGIMTTDGRAPEAALLDRLTELMRHRGPDGRGRHVKDDVGLVQTRLAIIDLETGDQPLYEPGGAALVCNGEIYNYIELRQALDGVNWKTGSDCEPPLHLYRRHGLAFPERLRGMYALAVHDPGERHLVLARDPFGIKPLYYVEAPGFFAFASEPQALIRSGLMEPRLDPASRGELLQLQFTTGRDTPFAGIRRVLPGETLVVAGGRIVERRRRPNLPAAGPAGCTEAEALERLDRALEDAVEVHQRSDVPYAMFLSGGIDSSALLALMARLNERPVCAFTAGFSETQVPDERPQARAVARACGAEHVEVEFGERDFWALAPQIAAAMDDPAADYAVLPSYKLAQEASRGFKVILCGEGGDELFAGYGRYRRLMRPPQFGRRAPRRYGTFDRLPGAVLRDRLDGWRDGLTAAETGAAQGGLSRLQVAQAVDCADWLPNDLLTKLDRCLMAHGVEGRTPYLDPVVAEVAFRLPDRMKVRQRHGKWLLRRWLAEHRPEAKPFSRKKGFTVPVGEWLRRRGDTLGPLVAAQPGIAEMCRPDATARLFRSPDRHAGFAAWTLLFYALWHRHHILGLAAQGDVFETLAATPKDG
ncbi:MAG: asparagine synthase (glutamine-hydrolyzing) [Kiloniellales bacterium]